jgi:hypothetical protein
VLAADGPALPRWAGSDGQFAFTPPAAFALLAFAPSGLATVSAVNDRGWPPLKRRPVILVLPSDTSTENSVTCEALLDGATAPTLEDDARIDRLPGRGPYDQVCARPAAQQVARRAGGRGEHPRRCCEKTSSDRRRHR